MCIINKFFMFFVLSVLSASYSQVALSEDGLGLYDGMSKTISVIDRKKNIIVLADKKFLYDKNTVILNYKGEKITADSLQKDDFVRIQLNINQRYIIAPLLKRIQVETGD